MEKFVLKNSETGFQKAETCFQNAETRFQNAKTALSRIFFARNGMDSAQKKPDISPYFFIKIGLNSDRGNLRIVGRSPFKQQHSYLILTLKLGSI